MAVKKGDRFGPVGPLTGFLLMRGENEKAAFLHAATQDRMS